MTGETPEVRSDKRKPREESEEREEIEAIEDIEEIDGQGHESTVISHI